MSDNTAQVLCLLLIIVAIFLFAGEPDITDSIIKLIQSKIERNG